MNRYYNNKKGFTLIELIVSVSIFSIIILMTFSAINLFPKLAKAESGKFSERAYVRSALLDMTDTIQNSETISIGTQIEFTMPGGSTIKYEFTNGNVNKVVNDGGTESVHRLMESIAAFSITPESNHLFDIAIRTREEGKDYNFKVNRRRGDEVGTNAEISTIAPVSVTFDKNPACWADVELAMELNGNTFIGLRNDIYILSPVRDYFITGNIVTIRKEYLAALPDGEAYITFNVGTGIDPVLDVTVVNTGGNIKIAGNSYEDDIVRMEYPDNNKVSIDDNTWILQLTGGSAADDVAAADLTVSGLPQGIGYSVERLDGNRLLITLSGQTFVPVAGTVDVEIIIKGSAVTETGALDSEAIDVLILSGESFASPEHNLVFTNELVINNSVRITGDIVIGRGMTETDIKNNSEIYGYVYADSSLNVSNNVTFGKPSKNSVIFVRGTAAFHGNSNIYGDLYYRDRLVVDNRLDITGKAEKKAVDIPEVSLPELMPDQWYIDRGYTVVERSNSKVELQDNGRYLFKEDYEFKDNTVGLDNIIIVGKGDLVFKNSFSGSGIVFAPNGKIIFENNCDFTGSTISKTTVLNNQSILAYRRFSELPFEQSKGALE